MRTFVSFSYFFCVRACVRIFALCVGSRVRTLICHSTHVCVRLCAVVIKANKFTHLREKQTQRKKEEFYQLDLQLA